MIPTDLLIAKGAIVKHFSAGEYLYEEGAMSTYYYQIVEGKVRVCNFLADGKEVLHTILGMQESVNYLGYTDLQVYTVSAIIDCPSTIIKIPINAFKEILEQHTTYLMVFLKQLSDNLNFKMFITKILSLHHPEEMLSALIQYLNQDKRLICQECKRLMLTRQQLANMTGMRVETIIRTMKQMQKCDKLNIVKGKVFVPSDGIE